MFAKNIPNYGICGGWGNVYINLPRRNMLWMVFVVCFSFCNLWFYAWCVCCWIAHLCRSEPSMHNRINQTVWGKLKRTKKKKKQQIGCTQKFRAKKLSICSESHMYDVYLYASHCTRCSYCALIKTDATHLQTESTYLDIYKTYILWCVIPLRYHHSLQSH